MNKLFEDFRSVLIEFIEKTNNIREESCKMCGVHKSLGDCPVRKNINAVLMELPLEEDYEELVRIANAMAEYTLTELALQSRNNNIPLPKGINADELFFKHLLKGMRMI